MRYHVDGGYSPYRFIDVATGSSGKAIVSWQRHGEDAVKAEYAVEPWEWQYFLGLFRLSDFFNLKPGEDVLVEDRSLVTLSLKVGDRSRELAYTWDDDENIDRITQPFWEVFCKALLLHRGRGVAADRAGRHPDLGHIHARWDLPLLDQRKRGSEILNTALSGQPEPSETLQLYRQMRLPGDGRTVDLFLRQLQAHYHPQYRSSNPTYEFVKCLGLLGDRKAVPFLIKIAAESESYKGAAVLALARLECDAILPEALHMSHVEAVGHVGRGRTEVICLLEKEAYGLSSSRHRRWLAYDALARTRSLRLGAKTDALTHVLIALLCVAGLGLVAAPLKLGRLLARLGPVWPRLIGFCLLALCGFALFALHVTFFY